MRLVTLLALVLGLTASAFAIDINYGVTMGDKPEGPGGTFDGDRVGGDTIALAAPIGALPFMDSGYTCDYNDDYDEWCPYSGSTAPDVVYSFAPGANTVVDVSLCQSMYDTKVYVYENDEFTLVACNDDACNFQSQIMGIGMTAGNTYYIVVDGYGGSCGYYILDVSEFVPCVVECPPYCMLEGEPTCYPNYDDQYNGGCNTLPFPVFQPVMPCDPLLICGETGVFPYDTTTYRDTDWYELTITELTTICVGGEYACNGQTLIIDGRYGCDGSLIPAYYQSTPCEEFAGLCWDCDAGTWWVWSGPTDWGDYPCGTVYWINITGYGGGVSPAESSTWGTIKNLFK